MDQKDSEMEMIQYSADVLKKIFNDLWLPTYWMVDEEYRGTGNHPNITAHAADEHDLGVFCIKHVDVTKNATVLNAIAEKMNLIMGCNIISYPCEILEKIATDLSNTLKSAWVGRASYLLQAYGSFENGLCCLDSSISFDVDKCDDIQGLCERITNKTNSGNEDARFRHAEFDATNPKYLLKLVHKSTGIRTVISFTNQLRLKNAALMRLYLNLDANLRPLILYLKHILVLQNLHGHDKITNYQLFWFVTFLMQHKNLLPSVKTVRSAAVEKIYVDGKWSCAVPYSSDTVEFRIRSNKSVKETPASLFLSFVGFYKDFDFLRYVISPYLGYAIPIHHFDSMHIDVSGLEKCSSCDFGKPLFVKNAANFQDPTILHCNLFESVRPEVINSFKLLCKLFHRYFTDSIFGSGNMEINLPIVLSFNSSVDFIQFTSITLHGEMVPDSQKLNRWITLAIRILMENFLKFTLISTASIMEKKTHGWTPTMYFDYYLDANKRDTIFALDIVPEAFKTAMMAMKMYIVIEIHDDGKIQVLMEGTACLIEFFDAYGHDLLQHILSYVKLHYKLI